MEVKEALSRLDPFNDAHWTAGGEPLMAAVESFIGDDSVTRGDLKKVAPNFNREMAAKQAAQKGQPEVADAKPAGHTTVKPAPQVAGAPAYSPDKGAPVADQDIVVKAGGKYIRESLPNGLVVLTRVA